MLILPCFNLSSNQDNLILMCLELLAHDFFVISHCICRLIVLPQNVWFYWVSLCFQEVLIPNVVLQIIIAIYNFLFFELLKFIFCLLNLDVNTLMTKLLTPPICPLMSICTAWDELTQVCISCRSFSPMILLSSTFWFMKHSNLFKLFQYSTTGWFILVHSNDISVSQSCRPLCKIHSIFMITEWKMSSLLPCNYPTFSTVNRHFVAVEVTTWGTSYPNSCTASLMYYLISIAILIFFR